MLQFHFCWQAAGREGAHLQVVRLAQKRPAFVRTEVFSRSPYTLSDLAARLQIQWRNEHADVAANLTVPEMTPSRRSQGTHNIQLHASQSSLRRRSLPPSLASCKVCPILSREDKKNDDLRQNHQAGLGTWFCRSLSAWCALPEALPASAPGPGRLAITLATLAMSNGQRPRRSFDARSSCFEPSGRRQVQERETWKCVHRTRSTSTSPVSSLQIQACSNICAAKVRPTCRPTCTSAT